MPPIAVLARIAAPVVLVAGGITAFVAAGASTSPPAIAAWVDSPLDGSSVAPGALTVQMHASASVVDAIDLVVDGDVVGSAASLQHFDHLASGAVAWTATAGPHRLVARARSGSGSADSATVTVLVSAGLLRSPARGDAPRPGSTTTSTTSTTTTTTTTTTTAPATTTQPSPTTAATAPPAPPRLLRLLHSPTEGGTTRTPITLTAYAIGPTGAALTVRIQARVGSGGWETVQECPPGTSPCTGTRTFGEGTWRYRATVTDAFGQQATAGDTTDTQFTITPAPR